MSLNARPAGLGAATPHAAAPADAEPSALHRHRGIRAVQRLVEHAPHTGGLALWVRHADLAPDVSKAPVTTDGRTVFYGAGFEALPLPLQAGWVAHQVLHVALRHPQRFAALQRLGGDADLKLFNVCADAIVNSALARLAWLQLPPRAVTLPALLAAVLGVQQGAEAALLEWDVERLYRAIDDRQPAARGRHDRQAGTRSGEAAPNASKTSDPSRADGPCAARARALGAATAIDLLPDARPGEAAEAPEAEAEQSRQWAERLLRGHAGDGAHSLLRTLLADVPQPRTPWEQVLRTQLARALAQRPGLSWSRPARSYIANQGRAGPRRRMPWEPGTTASRAVPRLALVVDVSGSIAAALLARFATEIDALSRRLEATLVLVIGDDRVQRVQHFEPGRSELAAIGFHGGGGTDFTPLLQEAARHRPDIAVVLTDLDGPARFRPPCPVVWAVPEVAAMPSPPFGRLLALR